MKNLILVALLCLIGHSSYGVIYKDRDNGVLWHYKYINERTEGGDTYLRCLEPGWNRCRSVGMAIALSDKMDEAEATIAQEISNNVTSGTLDYPAIRYFVEWSSDESGGVSESWYTYDEAVEAGLM